MSEALQVFKKDEFQVRSFQEDDGSIWFVAKDVAEALDYSYWQPHIVANVPEIWRGIKRINTTSDKPTARPYQDVLCLSEQGLYFFLGRSDKPKALPYQMWIAGEVVPSIRQNGFYATRATAEAILNDPDTFIVMLQKYKELQAKNEFLEHESRILQSEINVNKPKVLFADSVSASDKSILIRDLAKLLHQNGYETGERRLYQELRKRGYIMKKDYANMPTQKSMNLGLMEVVERTINRGDGNSIVRTTTRITGKGQIYFINLFLGEQKD